MAIMERSRRLWASFVALTLTVLTGCAAIDTSPPGVSLVDLRVSNMSMFETGLKVVVRYQNFDDKPLQVRGASHELSINGNYIGRGASGRDLEVPAYGSATDTLEVHLSNLALFRRIQDLFEQPAVDYEVDSEISLGSSWFGRTIRASNEGRIDLTLPEGKRREPRPWDDSAPLLDGPRQDLRQPSQQ